MSEKKGFFGSLFDLSFSEFVTTRIIKFLFVLAIIGAALLTLAMVAGGFLDSEERGIMMLVLSPFVFFLYVLISRIYLELIIVLFRIAENTGRLVKQNET